MKIMMLTAGEGTRLRPYTHKLPKPALPFLGVPLLTYPLTLVKDLGITDIVFNTYHLPELLKKTVRGLSKENGNIHFSDEVGQIRASAGGLYLAKDHFVNEKNFILMNGDEVFIPSKNFNINQAYQQHVETKSLATLFVTEHEGVGTRFGGVWCDSKMRVKDFGKGPVKENLKGWHYIGHMILSHEIFKFINSSEPLNIIYDVLLKQIQQGEKVMAYNSQGLWFETGNKEDYLKAHTEGLKILAPEAQEEKSKESALGYKLWLKNHIEHFQSAPFQMHKKNAGLQWTSTASKISDSATLSGYCVIGAGAVLGDDSHVEHSVVIENAQLEPGQHITNEIWI